MGYDRETYRESLTDRKLLNLSFREISGFVHTQTSGGDDESLSNIVFVSDVIVLSDNSEGRLYATGSGTRVTQ